jgi:hypothetical protein
MRSFDSATCPICQTYFDRLPVDGDEDGAYVVLETRPCADCGAPLCACCDAFECEACCERFCNTHMVKVVGGSHGEIWKCCAACAREIEQQELELELPAAIPAQSETRPYLVAKAGVA